MENNDSMSTYPVSNSNLYQGQQPFHNSIITHSQPLPISSVNQPQPVPNAILDHQLFFQNISIEEFFNRMPPGYKFIPTDGELIFHYLMRKVNHQPLPPTRIVDVDLYKFEPKALSKKYGKNEKDKLMYFFTPREKKYRRGKRPRRSAGNGYWKATGADKLIKYMGKEIGYKKALVYYKGKPPNGRKSNWIMHEYRVKDPPAPAQSENKMRLDDCVLCDIHKKLKKSNNVIDRKAANDEDNPAKEAPGQEMLPAGTNNDHQNHPFQHHVHQSITMSSTPQFNAAGHLPSMTYMDNLYPTPIATVPFPVMDPSFRNIYGPAVNYSSMHNIPVHPLAQWGREEHCREEALKDLPSKVDHADDNAEWTCYINPDVETCGKPGTLDFGPPK